MEFGNLKGLSNSAMIGATEGWVDPARERTQLAEASQSKETVSKSDLLNARNQWIRVVRAILAGLELSEKTGENTMFKILQPLKNAVGKLGAKSSAKSQPVAEQV